MTGPDRAEAARRRAREALFGESSPASADERDDADRGREDDARSFYERERPPHHDRER